MTRLGQTLLHIKNVVWIVAEDTQECTPLVESILARYCKQPGSEWPDLMGKKKSGHLNQDERRSWLKSDLRVWKGSRSPTSTWRARCQRCTKSSSTNREEWPIGWMTEIFCFRKNLAVNYFKFIALCYFSNEQRILGLNRNAGVEWIKGNVPEKLPDGVLYFGDDDNTYDLRLFEEIRRWI